MQYVIATSKPIILDNITRSHSLVLLDGSKDTYTTDIAEACIFHSYDEAQTEAENDASNDDFVIALDIAEKIFDYGKYKWK
jgi:hypothetical protein